MGVQVQSATKDRQGNPLSILNRQFISFSYGGKNIEDFDLLAVFSNDRLNKEIYAPFNDTTTEQAELDGQMFWRTNFKAGGLSFNLATDGITSAQLEEFKIWFQPGIERELILSEYHNRGILARVSSTPQMSLLPFEKEVEVAIGQDENLKPIYYKTKISLYKGEIKLDFIMDDPYWYSIQPYINDINEESLKLIYEDGIPHLNMLKTSCFLANRKYFDGTQIQNEYSGYNFEVAKQNDIYLYNCGTAAEKPILEFNVSVELNLDKEDEYRYYYRYNNLVPTEEGYITFQKSGYNSKFLYFSLPSLLTSYNKAIEIVQNFLPGESSILDLRKELRDNLYNYYTRSFAIGIVDAARQSSKYSQNGLILAEFHDFFYQSMTLLLNDPSLKYYINCQTGEVLVTASISKLNSYEIKEDGSITLDYSTSLITENAGNMIKSNYLNIDIRTLPDKGIITSAQCIYISANTDISNFIIDYKYKYL